MGDQVLDKRARRLRGRREQERAAAEIASDTSELLRTPPAASVGDAAMLLGVQRRAGSASC